MNKFFFIFASVFIDLWISWPGIIIANNWKTFKEFINKSTKNQISFKAALAIAPKLFIKR